MESESSSTSSCGKTIKQQLYRTYQEIGESDILAGFINSNISDRNILLQTQRLQGKYSKALRKYIFIWT